AYAPLQESAVATMRSQCETYCSSRRLCTESSLSGRGCSLLDGHKEEHRGSFRTTKVCLCGKSQVSRGDAFEAPRTPLAGLPPSGPCCHNVNFLPFLPLSCDFVPDPVLIPVSPRLSKVKVGGQMNSSLPSALPAAGGFVALVADPPLKVDPLDGS
ncbi:unnamed protein product, partial [Polarella glacialis]